MDVGTDLSERDTAHLVRTGRHTTAGLGWLADLQLPSAANHTAPLDLVPQIIQPHWMMPPKVALAAGACRTDRRPRRTYAPAGA